MTCTSSLSVKNDTFGHHFATSVLALRVLHGLPQATHGAAVEPREECADVSAGMKKIVGWLAIALVAFYLITNPTDAAGAVRGIGGFLSDAFQSIINFLTSVFS
jgi:hypothetical protein